MLKFKQSLLFLMAVVVVVMQLVGCTSAKPTSDSKDDIPEIIWNMPGEKQPGTDRVIEAINEKLVEKIGARLNLKVIDNGSYEQRINLAISGGEAFDICFTSSWQNKYIDNVLKGAFLGIDDYLNNMPNLKNALPDFVWEGAKIEGKIYAVPNYQVLFSQPCLRIQEDFIEKYGYDLLSINKLEDIEPFLKIIKEKEANIYPYDPTMNLALPDYEMIPSANVVINKYDKALKVVNPYELPEYFDYLKLMNKWYEKGYIRSDVASASDTSSLAKRKYAVFVNTVKPGDDAEMEARFGTRLEAVPLVKPYVTYSAVTLTMNAISKTSKNPQKALALLELMNTEKEIYNMLCFGIEGTDYNKISDNVIKQVENCEYAPNVSWKYGNQFNAYYIDGQKVGTWEETDRLNHESTKSPLTGFSFNAENIKNEIAQVSVVISEYKFLELGVEAPKIKYDVFINKLKHAGIDTIVKETQRQIDEWQSSNK